MHVSEINIYPVKSLKGISLDSSTVERRGLTHDRRWMVTDPGGKFLTQRELPKMATIRVETSSDDALILSVNGSGGLQVPFPPGTGEFGIVEVWGSLCEGEFYDEEVSEWISRWLGTECRLVAMPDATERHINTRFDRGNDIVSFADGYPLLLTSEASLADLNARLGADAPRLPMERFRPNIVVSGSTPYAEDSWKSIRVGDAVFRSTKPCARCVITTVDQASGQFAGKEPLATLAAYRLAKMVMPDRILALGLSENAVLFGQNLVPDTPGATIRVGDEVTVLETY